MSNTQTSILLLGATGYIAGSFLTRLLVHPAAASFAISAVVRSPEKAKALSDKYGVRTIVGTYDAAGRDTLVKAASEAHIVFNCADADNYVLAEALLEGLAKRHADTGDVPLYIHTSGTGVLTDDAKGMHPTSTIYSDADPAQIESLAPTQLHRNVDLMVLSHDARGAVRSYIVLPSTIYGLASGPLVDAGLVNPHSIQIPMLIQASVDRGAAGTVGAGKNIWPNVHVDDVADLYVVILENLLAGNPIGHGREGYYFGENGEHTLYDVGKAIGAALVELGKAKSAEPTAFSEAELEKYFGGSDYMGTNSRCRADRSRAIGWKPVYLTKDMLASIKPEIEAMLAHPERVKLALK